MPLIFICLSCNVLVVTEVDLNLSEPLGRCNCSICERFGATSKSVKASAFRITTAVSNIGQYRTKPDLNGYYRAFCKLCGVHTYCGDDAPQSQGGVVVIDHCSQTLLSDISFSIGCLSKPN
jgi:hypothetical protein